MKTNDPIKTLRHPPPPPQKKKIKKKLRDQRGKKNSHNACLELGASEISLCLGKARFWVIENLPFHLGRI